MESIEIAHTIQSALSIILAFTFYIALPAFIIIKALKRKKLPNNNYTPLDDILEGRLRDSEGENNKNVEDDSSRKNRQ